MSYNEKKANLADIVLELHSLVYHGTADSDSSQGEIVSRHVKIKRDLPLVMDCIDKCRAFGDQSAEKLGLLRRLIPHGDSYTHCLQG